MKKILIGLSRKYPWIDLEKALENMQARREYLNHTISFPVVFHARQFFPSIIKTAAEFYIFSGGVREEIEDVLMYIKAESESDVTQCCQYYYPQRELLSGDKENIFHHIIIRGSEAEHILYGFVSYFGIIQCLVLLNSHYTGSDCNYSYTYNVLSQEEDYTDIALSLTEREILQALTTPYEAYINDLMSAGMEFIHKASRIKQYEMNEKMLRAAWDRTIGRYPEGTVISLRMMREFIDEYEEEMVPWLAANMGSADSHLNRPVKT